MTNSSFFVREKDLFFLKKRIFCDKNSHFLNDNEILIRIKLDNKIQ